MEYKANDQVILKNGSKATIENVLYEMIDGKETNKIYCYEMTIGDLCNCIIYPDEIDHTSSLELNEGKIEDIHFSFDERD